MQKRHNSTSTVPIGRPNKKDGELNMGFCLALIGETEQLNDKKSWVQVLVILTAHCENKLI